MKAVTFLEWKQINYEEDETVCYVFVDKSEHMITCTSHSFKIYFKDGPEYVMLEETLYSQSLDAFICKMQEYSIDLTFTESSVNKYFH